MKVSTDILAIIDDFSIAFQDYIFRVSEFVVILRSLLFSYCFLFFYSNLVLSSPFSLSSRNMMRNLPLILVFTLLATCGLGFLLQSAYPFVLASETARKSVEVSKEQTLELNEAELKSDMIAFAVFSAVLCGGLASLLVKADNLSKRIVGLGMGIVLGAMVGAGVGWLGHWFEAHPSIDIQDAMLYFCLRWSIMLVPIAIATAFLCSLIGGAPKNLLNSIIGGILGALVASSIYAVLSGLVTTVEGRHKVLPFFLGNRILIIACSIFCIGAGIAWQLYEKKSSPNIKE